MSRVYIGLHRSRDRQEIIAIEPPVTLTEAMSKLRRGRLWVVDAAKTLGIVLQQGGNGKLMDAQDFRRLAEYDVKLRKGGKPDVRQDD